jgi:hypothetical protein
MKYLKYFESDTSSLVMDLKDMSLELVDDGFKVEVYTNEEQHLGQHPAAQFGNRKGVKLKLEFLVVINKQNIFMMEQNLKDFILRSTNYMKLEGYKSNIHSNYGTLLIIDENIFIKKSLEELHLLLKVDQNATYDINYASADFCQFTTINISFYFGN